MRDDVAAQREHFVAWLRQRSGTAPELRETHVSIIGLTRDRVWKLKKAVRFAFIDLSTAELRLANCEREVTLNRRLAPDVYLGVVPLVDEHGVVLDHVVEMRRLPDNRRLAVLAAARGTGAVCVDEIAGALARFHARAPTGGAIDRCATGESVAALWSSSVTELEPFVGRVLDAATFARVRDDALRYVDGRAALFEERIANGRIRDGHGDLLADDVFCLDDGPRILDCLEFDDRLRYGDVLADVAFLAMDLERLGRGDLARRLLDRYRDQSGDAWPPSLEHCYIAYRALVRVKVACLRVDDRGMTDVDRNGATTAARELLTLAARHLAAARMRLVLVGGPPASGKTTLARELARITGWPVFHSDEVRKQLAGIEPAASAAAPVDRGLYAESWTALTYAELLDHARRRLGRGESVILDASWGAARRRSEAGQVAAATGSELVSLECQVPELVARERARLRTERAADASDASVEIASELRARFEPWPESLALDTTASPDEVARRVLARLDGAGAGSPP